MNKIFWGDCIKILPTIPDKSVDLILADLPYGKTKNDWDKPIPFEFLWQQYHRIAKTNAAIILFGQDKFTAAAIASNSKYHRYNLVWKKGKRTTGFLNAKKMPLRNHEDIMVFYKRLPVYNPQMVEGPPNHSPGKRRKNNSSSNYGLFDDVRGEELKPSNLKYPQSILDFNKPHPPVHQTQKPIELGEYLIKTYSNPGAVVMDNTMGIGTFCKAAANTGRKYIGIEIRKRFFDYALNYYNL